MMSEVREPQRPIPQFSLRSLLGATAVCAGFSSILAFAVRDHLWAIGVTVGVGSVVVLVVVCAGLFLVVWVLSDWAAFARQTVSRRIWPAVLRLWRRAITHGDPPS